MKRTILTFENGKPMKKELKIEDEENLGFITRCGVNLAAGMVSVLDWLFPVAAGFAFISAALVSLGLPFLIIYCIIRDNFGWILGV